MCTYERMQISEKGLFPVTLKGNYFYLNFNYARVFPLCRSDRVDYPIFRPHNSAGEISLPVNEFDAAKHNSKQFSTLQ